MARACDAERASKMSEQTDTERKRKKELKKNKVYRAVVANSRVCGFVFGGICDGDMVVQIVLLQFHTRYYQ